jgi:hypothetical protein
VLTAALILPQPVGAQVVLTGYLGVSIPQPSNLSLRLPPRNTDLDLTGVSWRSESLTSPHYYGIRAEYRFASPAWLGLDVEFIHAKVFARLNRDVTARGVFDGSPVDTRGPLRDWVEQLAMSHGMNFLFFNVSARSISGTTDGFGVPATEWSVRVGAGPTIPHAETTLLGQSRSAYQWGGLGLQLAGGMSKRVGKSLSLLVEFKVTHNRLRFRTAEGSGATRLLTYHLVAGISWFR